MARRVPRHPRAPIRRPRRRRLGGTDPCGGDPRRAHDNTTDRSSTLNTPAPSVWKQPAQVWAVAFACVVAFMGIGLVDPILPAIAEALEATPVQTELLFTSYLAVTGLA